MAEALLKEKSGFEVKSAGIYASKGSLASPQSVEVLSEKNIKLSHQSQPLTNELVDWADLILTMTENHKQAVIQLNIKSVEKTFTLIEFVDETNPQRDISDPFGGPVEVYRHTMEQMEQYIERLVEKLKNF